MAWRVARSLDVLLGQLNARYPKRSKLSDGGIGDAAHATRDSDHNPWVLDGATGIVTARDYTHDPASGLDCEQLYQALIRSRDDRIKYVIWNRTITSGAHDTAPWQRRPYSGTNAHTKHLHLSVRQEKARYDNAAPWAIAPTAAKPAPVPEDDMPYTPEQIRDFIWHAPIDSPSSGKRQQAWEVYRSIDANAAAAARQIASLSKAVEDVQRVVEDVQRLVEAAIPKNAEA